MHRGISKEYWQDSVEECPHGKVRTYVDCSIKENVGSRHPSVNTDMFASDVARKDMLKRNV